MRQEAPLLNSSWPCYVRKTFLSIIFIITIIKGGFLWDIEVMEEINIKFMNEPFIFCPPRKATQKLNSPFNRDRALPMDKTRDSKDAKTNKQPTPHKTANI